MALTNQPWFSIHVHPHGVQRLGTLTDLTLEMLTRRACNHPLGPHSPPHWQYRIRGEFHTLTAISTGLYKDDSTFTNSSLALVAFSRVSVLPPTGMPAGWILACVAAGCPSVALDLDCTDCSFLYVFSLGRISLAADGLVYRSLNTPCPALVWYYHQLLVHLRSPIIFNRVCGRSFLQGRYCLTDHFHGMSLIGHTA